MKYHENGDPADLEAAYRMIEKNGYSYALDPIKERIAELEQPSYHDLDFARKENIRLHRENAELHYKLRVANNEKARLKSEYNLLSQDTGEEIHKLMMRIKGVFV